MKKTFLLIITVFLFAINPAFSATIVDTSLDSCQQMFILATEGRLSGVKIHRKIMEHPHRVVFDIYNMVLPGHKAKIDTKNNTLSSVKIAQFTDNSVRIVFTGTSETIDDIKISTVKNLVVFNLGEAIKTLTGSPVYTDKEPPPKAIDYFAFYENLNVVQSKDLNRKAGITPCVVKKPILSKQSVATTAGWKPINIIDLPANYNIFSIEAFEKGVKIQGLGSLSITSPTITPTRYSVDINDSAFQGKKIPGSIKLSPTDKVYFSVPSKNTIRVNIDTKTPWGYNAIISPDAMTLSIQKTRHLSALDFPTAKTTGLSSVTAQSQGKQITKLTIRAQAPIVHSISRSSDAVNLNFYNLNCTSGFMKNIVPTKQFRTLSITPMKNNMLGTLWKIPVKKSSLVSTNLSADGRELSIYIKDEMYKDQCIVIKSGTVVAVDAGHGGVDVGATRDGVYEKDINFEIANDLKKYLESKGVKVIMTRDTDVKIPLSERTSIANAANCDVFVSVHVNSATNSDVYGIETHWYKPNSQTLAKIIHNNVTLGVDGYDRGVIQSQFYVINHSVMPAVLVEVGFISNCRERCDMMREQRKQATAKYIGNGVLLYLAMQYDNEGKLRANAK